MNIIFLIIVLVWLIGMPVSYKMFISKWNSNTKFEKIWYTIIWPLLMPLYCIHYVYNNLL